jgi:hypothetical protein
MIDVKVSFPPTLVPHNPLLMEYCAFPKNRNPFLAIIYFSCLDNFKSIGDDFNFGCDGLKIKSKRLGHFSASTSVSDGTCANRFAYLIASIA